jgi:hypothetical protein
LNADGRGSNKTRRAFRPARSSPAFVNANYLVDFFLAAAEREEDFFVAAAFFVVALRAIDFLAALPEAFFVAVFLAGADFFPVAFFTGI